MVLSLTLSRRERGESDDKAFWRGALRQIFFLA
jgi:hypothetical protein